MTQHTDQWLHDQFQAQAQTIEPPADLHGRSVERAYTAKTRRRRIQGTLAVGVAAVVTGAIVIVSGSLSPATQPTPADLTPAPTSWTFDLYFTTGGGRAVDPTAKNPGGRWKLTSETVTVPNSGDQPLDIVNALVAHAPTVEAINGFNFSSNGQLPIAEVNSVTVAPKVITVDLDREVWDPYPTMDCICPPGDAVMQQLVWTLDTALDIELPVLLTINGEPARGIWFQRLDGPVSLEGDQGKKQEQSAEFDKPGIKTEVDPPAPSIDFGTTNAWFGRFHGAHVVVYAGDAGYERPETGKVIVFTYDDDRTNRLGYTRTVPGSGALKIVAIAKPIIELQDRSGARYELNLDTGTLR